MKRKRRTEILIKGNRNLANTLFYLGETLVTEATVYVNGSIGLGIVQGDEPELAYNLAVIDGAYNLNAKETIDWKELLLKE